MVELAVGPPLGRVDAGNQSGEVCSIYLIHASLDLEEDRPPVVEVP